jgi:hypothetical protein
MERCMPKSVQDAEKGSEHEPTTSVTESEMRRVGMLIRRNSCLLSEPLPNCDGPKG